jgi:hypothetical protein
MHLNHRLQKYKIKIHIQININKINIIQTKGIFGDNKRGYKPTSDINIHQER